MKSKNIIQMNLFPKQKQTHSKQAYDYQRGKMRGGINLDIYTQLYVK